MVMAGYVYMGEYSSACVCRPRTAGGRQAQLSNDELLGLISGETAGVILQMRAAAEEHAAAAR